MTAPAPTRATPSRGAHAPASAALALCAAMLFAGCAPRPAPPGPAVPAEAAALPRPTPLADHHLHLFDESVSRVYRPPAIPDAPVPAEVARLLRARERSWEDTLALAPLYADSAAVLDSRGRRWVHGRADVARYVASSYARQYRFAPAVFQAEGSGAHLAAYLVRGEGEEARIFGSVLLSLARGADGGWRIAAEAPILGAPSYPDPFTAEKMVALLDRAGIRRATVLSTAYWFGSGSGPAQPGEYEKVRAETDWVAAQVARYPDRLVGFCSFNPLKDYALDALARCAATPGIRGLKQHFGDSQVDLRNPEHVEKVVRVFGAANRARLPIVVDLRTSDPAYGREHSEIFLARVIPAAPDVTIQIAHLAGSGPGYNSDAAFEVFARAAEAGDPRMRNVYSDVATVVTPDQPPEELALIARRMRQFGLHRVLYGSDHPASAQYTPEMAWLYFMRLPLTDAELRTVAGNLAPYLR